MTGRRYPARPLVGVGIVVLRGAEVLLVRRGREPRKGQWGLPGGLQELGETLFEAARREVAEETGVAVEPVEILTAVDSLQHDADGAVEYHYTLVEVGARWVSGRPVAADDVDAAEFVPVAEAVARVEWPVTREVIRLAEARLAPADPGGAA